MYPETVLTRRAMASQAFYASGVLWLLVLDLSDAPPGYKHQLPFTVVVPNRRRYEQATSTQINSSIIKQFS